MHFQCYARSNLRFLQLRKRYWFQRWHWNKKKSNFWKKFVLCAFQTILEIFRSKLGSDNNVFVQTCLSDLRPLYTWGKFSVGKLLKVTDDFKLYFSGNFPKVTPWNFYSRHFSSTLLYRNMKFIEQNYCLKIKVWSRQQLSKIFRPKTFLKCTVWWFFFIYIHKSKQRS